MVCGIAKKIAGIGIVGTDQHQRRKQRPGIVRGQPVGMVRNLNGWVERGQRRARPLWLWAGQSTGLGK